VPRKSRQAGVWFATQDPDLKRLFNSTPFEGDRWRPGCCGCARRSGQAVWSGSAACQVMAIWLAQSEPEL
jgi:hypothetical protein